jgi:hypothetical protein
MPAAEIIVIKVERQRIAVIIEFLAERIGQRRKALRETRTYINSSHVLTA